MEVTDVGAKQQAPDEAQDGVADEAVQRRHCARRDAADEAVSDHQLLPGTKLRHEPVQPAEVIAVVGVPKNHEAPTRCRNAADERAAIAAVLDLDDARSCLGGKTLRPVGGPVVGNDYFANSAKSIKEILRLPDTDSNRFRLVQAGHQDGKFYSFAGHRGARIRAVCGPFRPQSVDRSVPRDREGWHCHGGFSGVSEWRPATVLSRPDQERPEKQRGRPFGHPSVHPG